MSLITSLLTGGSNNHEETSENANGPATDLFTEGVVGDITNTSGVAPATGAFAVNAQGSPDMTVAVSAGVAWVTATPSSQNSQNLRVRNTATANVTISANSSGSTKYDWVYISISAANAANPNAGADNVATLTTSRSSSSASDDGTPPTYGLLLAVVTVANGASSITNGNISDERVAGLISTQAIQGRSVTPAKWTNPYCFRAFAAAGTTLTDNTAVKITFGTESYDYNSNFASSTYTAPVAGVYHFDACFLMGSSASPVYAYCAIYVNGALAIKGPQFPGNANAASAHGVFGDLLLAAGDTVEVYGLQDSGGSESTDASTTTTYFNGHLIYATP